MANICPTKSPKNEEKATKLILTESRTNSIDIKSEITFLRLIKIPLTPIQNKSEERITK
jgi:hypothetical protein